MSDGIIGGRGQVRLCPVPVRNNEHVRYIRRFRGESRCDPRNMAIFTQGKGATIELVQQFTLFFPGSTIEHDGQLTLPFLACNMRCMIC